MNNMNVQHTLWKSESKSAKGKLKTLPGDALLTAACVCYHGPLDSRTRSGTIFFIDNLRLFLLPPAHVPLAH